MVKLSKERENIVTAMLIRKSVTILAKMFGYSQGMLLSIMKSDSQRSREIIGIQWRTDFLQFRCVEKCGCIANQVDPKLIPKPSQIFQRVPRGPFLFYCANAWKGFASISKF
ncbi:hypothetical protein MHBO_000939 [Bonamia ostreae]|uniref:Uncharacterized protein n=1 Tax=Bonamia ostreae TaxID=126728 RepID=A0ABV2AH92_9EUKA